MLHIYVMRRYIESILMVKTGDKPTGSVFHPFVFNTSLTSTWRVPVFTTAIHTILLWRAKPGLLHAPKLSLSAIWGMGWPHNMATWPTPVTHYVGFRCRIGNDRPRLDFSMAFSLKM